MRGIALGVREPRTAALVAVKRRREEEQLARQREAVEALWGSEPDWQAPPEDAPREAQAPSPAAATP